MMASSEMRLIRRYAAAALLALAAALPAAGAGAQTTEAPAGEKAVEQEKSVTDEVKVEPEAEKTARQLRQERRESITGEKMDRVKQLDRTPAEREKAERKKLDRSIYDRRKVR